MAGRSGYARLAQVDEFDEESQRSDTVGSRIPVPKSVNIVSQPTHIHRVTSSISAGGDHVPPATPFRTRRRSNSGIDIKAINARLERYLLDYSYFLPIANTLEDGSTR
jgi:hypothetical protein